LGRHFATQHLDVLDATAADLAKAAARFKPTHLYYFATPRIFGRRRDPFDIDLFQRFVSFYVTGFVRVCSAVAANSRPLRVFFPSSTALDEGARELVEYSAAKAAGELACRGLDSAAANLQITVERLPRVATGQTASIVRARAADPCTVMLPIVRRLHASG
jgi:NAD(P)-dependent dehydrogenase (short-subunit alcohol dehydrogenase family)